MAHSKNRYTVHCRTRESSRLKAVAQNGRGRERRHAVIIPGGPAQCHEGGQAPSAPERTRHESRVFWFKRSHCVYDLFVKPINCFARTRWLTRSKRAQLPTLAYYIRFPPQPTQYISMSPKTEYSDGGNLLTRRVWRSCLSAGTVCRCTWVSDGAHCPVRTVAEESYGLFRPQRQFSHFGRSARS